MEMELQKQLNEVDNSVRMITCSQPAFIKVLGTILRKQSQFTFQLLQHTLSKLSEKDFELYRGILVQPRRLSPILKACVNIQQLSLLLREHHEYIQKTGYDYGEEMFQLVDEQIGRIGDENRQFLCYLVDDFYQFKKMSKGGVKWTRIGEEEKRRLENRVYLMLEYVVGPVLAYYGHKCNRAVYQPILCKWMLLLSHSDTPKHNKLIYELSKRILSLCSPLTEIRSPLAQAFSLFLNFCEIEYNDTELFNISDNISLFLNYINPNIIPELTRTWMRGLRTHQPEVFVNVCENLANSHISLNNLKVIQTISTELKLNCDFIALEMIYENVVKRRLCKCTYRKQSTLIVFLDIVIFYVVGFINTQRIDDQLQSLSTNYQNNLLYSPHHQLQTSAYKLKLLLSVCHLYFKNLTNNSRNLSRQLTKLFQSKLGDLVELRVREYVMNNRFPVDFNQQLRQGRQYELQASNRYVGICNIGNTCYMNAYVQALHMTKGFRSMFVDIDVEDGTNGTGGVSAALSELFHELTKRTPDLHPFKLKSRLLQPFRSSTQQQDSAEFGRSLLQQLNQDFKNTLFADPFNDIFTTCINKIMGCNKCGSGSNQLGYYKNLILPLGGKNEPIFLSERLKDMFQAENLGKADMVMCGRCKGKQEFFVKEVPEVFSSCLTFALNRFEFDKQQKQFIKKFNPVNFQFQIDLKNSVPNLSNIEAIYELYAFIVHIGTSPHGGHYITYARNISENPNLWYTFDDGYVTEKEVLTFGDFNLGEYDSPYILFYGSQTGRPVVARGLSKIKKVVSNKRE